MANNDANIKINGDASGLVRATTVAKGALAALQQEMSALEQLSARGLSASGVAGIGLSATAAAAALAAAVKSAADYGDALDNLAKRTGESVENLSRLQYAAKMSDLSNESLAKGLKNLAGQIVGAAHGAEGSAAIFEKYGIAVRNTNGTVRSTSEVLMDFADVFAEMADGPEKAALAAELFGAKLGTELIPLLNEGREGIKKLGDEAESLGLVMSAAQAKGAADFNDNLDRLRELAKGVAIDIGNALIPSINQFLAKMEDARRAKLTFWEILGVLPKQDEDVSAQLKKATAELERLKAIRDEIYAQNRMDGGATDSSSTDKDVAAAERRVAYLKAQNKRIETEEKDTAAERKKIALNLANALANLEQLRAIAAGKASADILKDDKTRTAEQIKEAEKLRDALKSAWETSRKEAQAAAEDAVKLMEKAQSVRTSARDKADAIRESGLTPEEKAAAALARAQDAQSNGQYYAAAAAAAQLDGRAADFEKYQKQAESFLDRAARFADQSGDANLVEQIGAQQAALIEAQARAKQAQSEALNAQAEGQLAKLKEVESQLSALQAKAASIEIKVKIEDALKTVSKLQSKWDALQDKSITLTVNTAGAPIPGGGSASPEGSGATGSFAAGGYTGPGGKFEAAGIVHRDEFVVNSERTREPGALDFLWRFHQSGMAALRGYSGGGLVGSSVIGNLPIPSISAAPVGGQSDLSSLVLDFSALGLGRHTTMARTDTKKEIEFTFRRLALRYGRD